MCGPGDVRFEEREEPMIAVPRPMGHECCGVVEDVGNAVRSIKPGQFVGDAQATRLRVPLADGTLVATPGLPPEELIPSPLTLSDVMGTGWFAADAANVRPGSTVAVVGDGAVGLLGVLSAKQMDAARIIGMSRHPARRKLAREFGATDLITGRGNAGVARVKEPTGGIGLVWERKITPRKVFDLTLPLERAAEGYRAMDERQAIKALLRP